MNGLPISDFILTTTFTTTHYPAFYAQNSWKAPLELQALKLYFKKKLLKSVKFYYWNFENWYTDLFLLEHFQSRAQT